MLYKKMQHYFGTNYFEPEDSRSVHFLMLPTPQDCLIHKDVELAVEHMQSVIELGRVIRDRKTIPLKVYVLDIVCIA